MDDIICTDVQYNHQKLVEECKLIDQISGNLMQVNLTIPQPRADLNLTEAQALSYGAGSLYKDNVPYDRESNWREINPLFRHLYVADVLDSVQAKVREYYPKVRVARARVMKLAPKTCLSFHIDRDSVVRAHIPIITSRACMFIQGTNVTIMDRLGVLYLFRTTNMHTAINATKDVLRTHIVVNFVADES